MLQLNQEGLVYLFDLASSHGSKINKVPIHPRSFGFGFRISGSGYRVQDMKFSSNFRRQVPNPKSEDLGRTGASLILDLV